MKKPEGYGGYTERRPLTPEEQRQKDEAEFMRQQEELKKKEREGNK